MFKACGFVLVAEKIMMIIGTHIVVKLCDWDIGSSAVVLGRCVMSHTRRLLLLLPTVGQRQSVAGTSLVIDVKVLRTVCAIACTCSHTQLRPRYNDNGKW